MTCKAGLTLRPTLQATCCMQPCTLPMMSHAAASCCSCSAICLRDAMSRQRFLHQRRPFPATLSTSATHAQNAHWAALPIGLRLACVSAILNPLFYQALTWSRPGHHTHDCDLQGPPAVSASKLCQPSHAVPVTRLQPTTTSCFMRGSWLRRASQKVWLGAGLHRIDATVT